jgi:(p)ppGpp synthase/HD superfamily hydrolase
MNYLEACYYSSRLLEKLKLLDTKNILDLELINKAIYWARKYHGDQKRKSGDRSGDEGGAEEEVSE